LLNSNISPTRPHNTVNFGALMRPIREFGHPNKFQRVSHLRSANAGLSSSGRQPNFAAFNRRCDLYLAGWRTF